MIEAPRLNAGVIVRLVVVFALVCGGFWWAFTVTTSRPAAGGDPCNDGTWNADREIGRAASTQSISAMTAAIDHGVAALTICVNDPSRGAVHHDNYVRGLAVAKRAAARWHAYGPNESWPTRGPVPNIPQY
jgi:hypothetical protein